MTFPTTLAGQPAGYIDQQREKEKWCLEANQGLDSMVIYFVVVVHEEYSVLHVLAASGIFVFPGLIWCIRWQLLSLCCSGCSDEKDSECECMCINIGISPYLIHITWLDWMSIVPCRVVCYYKFNVKSGSKKMREGGLGISNGSICLLFLLVSKCAKRKA